jgi:hypothetical protein
VECESYESVLLSLRESLLEEVWLDGCRLGERGMAGYGVVRKWKGEEKLGDNPPRALVCLVCVLCASVCVRMKGSDQGRTGRSLGSLIATGRDGNWRWRGVAVAAAGWVVVDPGCVHELATGEVGTSPVAGAVCLAVCLSSVCLQRGCAGARVAATVWEKLRQVVGRLTGG